MKIIINDKLNSLLKLLSDEQLLKATKYIIACMGSDDIIEATNDVECVLYNIFSERKRATERKRRSREKQRQQCQPETTQAPAPEPQAQVQHTDTAKVVIAKTATTTTPTVVKKEEVVNDEAWLEATAMQHHITKEEVVSMLANFDNFCVTQEKQHNTSKDYKQHFTNWLRRVQASKRAEQQSTTNTTNTTTPIDYRKQFSSFLYRLGDTPRAYDYRDDWQRIEEAERRDNKSYNELKELLLEGYTLLEMRMKFNKGIPAPPEKNYPPGYFENLFVNN